MRDRDPSPQWSQAPTQTPSVSTRLRHFALLLAVVLAGCGTKEVDIDLDTDLATSDTLKSEDTDTTDTDDTSGEIEEQECEPHNPDPWPETWEQELGADFRAEGGAELSGISGIPGATVNLPAQVIYGVGDGGVLYEMDGDFTFLRAWTLPTPEDIEGVGVNSLTGEIFTVNEDNSDVDGWMWLADVDPVKTSTDCTLNIPADIANNLGIEGFTYLPSDEAPPSWATESWADASGYLLAGSQTDSNVGVFPIGLCTNDAVLTPVLSILTSNADISGLATLKGNLYVLQDSAGTVDVIDLSTLAVTYTYHLPTTGSEEGTWVKLDDCDAVKGTGSMYIVDDVTGYIYRYSVPVNSAY